MGNTDVLVIGGGVIGCSIALRLAEARVKVTLVERNTIGREASWAAAGMLSAQTHAAENGAFFELGLRSRGMYKEFANRLRDISGVDAEYQDQGTLCLAMNEQEGKAMDEWVSWQQGAGLEVESLTSAEARKLEPSVSGRTAGGVFLPQDHQVENRHLMESLQAALNRLGVEIVEGTEVNALSVEGQRCTGVITASGAMTAGAVVLAAGSWSSSLLGDILPQVSV
ncbi:MAG: NAD(P)/FAD-dependent oxidoreductase, partial [Blastocatellia bacterium]